MYLLSSVMQNWNRTGTRMNRNIEEWLICRRLWKNISQKLWQLENWNLHQKIYAFVYCFPSCFDSDRRFETCIKISYVVFILVPFMFWQWLITLNKSEFLKQKKEETFCIHIFISWYDVFHGRPTFRPINFGPTCFRPIHFVQN